MKKIVTLLLVLWVGQIHAQQKITTAQWQKDLRFLQSTIHNNYDFLFVKTDKETFDQQVEQLHKDIPNLASHQIIVEMSKLVSLFKYGHTGIFLHLKSIPFHHLPLNLYEFTDGIFIQGVTQENKRALGAKVLKINGVEIREALQKIAPVVNSENSQYFKAYGINYLGILEVLHTQGITKQLESPVTLTLEKEGEVFAETFAALPAGETVPRSYGFVNTDGKWLGSRDTSTTPLYLKNLDKIYFSEYLAQEKTMYVRHSRIRDDKEEDTETFYNRVFDFIENNNVEKLVIDLRLNGGGNNYLNKPVIKSIMKSPKIDKVGNLYVIIGRRTFSACQNFVNELDNYTNAIFVGEPTAENVNFYGDANAVKLPNSKLTAYLSYAWWQDKPAWENADWKVPQLSVEISSKEYVSNQDPILDAALNFSSEGFIHKPMEYITTLFTKGDMQKLGMEVSKMVQNPRYSFVNFEFEFSKAAKRYLEFAPQIAVQIFSFNTQLFPNSANAWNDLGEGFLKMGNATNAIGAFKKAIALDPKGEIGKKATSLLKEIAGN